MDLAIVSFIIAVIGIVLQISDAFPEHRETRKTVVFMAIGMFLGIIASAMAGANYTITGNIDRRYAMLFGILACVLFCVTLAMIFRDEARQTIAVCSAIGLMIFLFLGGLVTAAGEADPHYAYSIDEIAVLADRAEKIGDLDTALDRLDELDSRIRSVEGSKRISDRMKKITAMQEQKIEGIER